MKIALTVSNINDLKSYIKETNTDIYIIGNELYANRLPGSFTMEDIEEANKLIKSNHKEIYINTNLIIHDNDLKKVNDYLDFLKPLKVDGIIFGDLAIYKYAKQKEMEDLLIYNPDTLNTNLFDPIFWNKKGIKGLTIAKEIVKEELIEIADHSKIETSIVGHGHLNMFHSRRPLIENFLQYNEQESQEYINNRNLHLIEENRNESYPVFQDNHGTHIFRPKIMLAYNEIIELSNHLDVFIVDSILKDKQYIINTINNYQNILNGDIKDTNSLSTQYENDHDSGFLYKKTVFDKY